MCVCVCVCMCVRGPDPLQVREVQHLPCAWCWCRCLEGGSGGDGGVSLECTAAPAALADSLPPPVTRRRSFSGPLPATASRSPPPSAPDGSKRALTAPYGNISASDSAEQQLLQGGRLAPRSFIKMLLSPPARFPLSPCPKSSLPRLPSYASLYQ